MHLQPPSAANGSSGFKDGKYGYASRSRECFAYKHLERNRWASEVVLEQTSADMISGALCVSSALQSPFPVFAATICQNV
jgi:hypothetical protein